MKVTALKVLHSLPSVVLVPQLLWPMLISPQHMSLVNVISVNFRVNRMARRLEPDRRKLWRGEKQYLDGGVEGIDPWDFNKNERFFRKKEVHLHVSHTDIMVVK
jgi:hypothetical protein